MRERAILGLEEITKQDIMDWKLNLQKKKKAAQKFTKWKENHDLAHRKFLGTKYIKEYSKTKKEKLGDSILKLSIDF